MLSVLSLVIVIHLTCVFVVLGSNLQRSALQSRLVSLFAVYTQFFDFDPDFTPYYFVSGRELNGLSIDDDAVLVLDLYADPFEPLASQKLLKTVTLPDRGSRWLGDRKRYIALAKAVVLNAALGADDITGEIAKVVGRRVMNENGAKRAVFRAVRRNSQPLSLDDVRAENFPLDPTDPRYDSVAYEADVWFDDDGTVEVVKRAAQGEVAPRKTNP
jgi:hypothetical protein